MAKPLDILVTGATGTQGGAVARQLIKKGHRIRALTRNVASPAAQALAALGVELAQGNLEDRASVDRALTGMEAMFSVATPYEHGPEAETRQSILATDAAAAAGAYLVYSSVANADRHTGDGVVCDGISGARSAAANGVGTRTGPEGYAIA